MDLRSDRFLKTGDVAALETYAGGGLKRNGRTVSWALDIRESVFRS